MKRVDVVGFGPGNPLMLTLEALVALERADAIVGASRLLEALPEGVMGERIPATLGRGMVEALKNREGWQRAAIVVSGDPGFFSGASRALEELADTGWEVRCLPGVGSAQLLAARLSRSWEGWRLASAHGKDADVCALASAGGPLFLLTDPERAPDAICGQLVSGGLGAARVTVGERLSYPDERIVTGTAEELARQSFAPLAAMLVEAAPARSPAWEWANAGVPDEAFVRGDAPMTKQETRSVALAKLKVAEDDVVYDVGSGTGSFAVELGLLAKRGAVYAIERDGEALSLVRENLASFGLSDVHVVEGEAPEAFQGLPAPDAAFVGGSGGRLPAIVDALLDANPRVRVVVACVTLETLSTSERLLSDEARFEGFEAVCLSTSRSERAGGSHLMRALNPVYLVCARGRGSA